MQKQDSNKYKIILIIVFVILLICVVMLLSNAYSKYFSKLLGQGGAEVAKIKSSTTVVSYNSSEDTINPYCEITVKNTDDNVLTEVAFQYIITITATEGTLPEYYCIDAQGNEVANSTTGATTITGQFGYEAADTHAYTLYFINTGEEDITHKINIETKTVQL